MRYYPVFYDLTGKTCLVVGAGEVGRRKIASLLETPLARLHLVDPAAPVQELKVFLEDKRVLYHQRPFTPEDVSGCLLVYAATADRLVNADVLRACQQKGIACNCADAPEGSSFIVPAVIEQGNITIALSTNGGSPALARKLRKELEGWLGERYTGLSELLSRLRPLVLALRHETRQNTALFRELVESPLGDALYRRDSVACESLLRELLPQELHPYIMELLHDLA